MYNSYQIAHRPTESPPWQLFTGDLVVIRKMISADLCWTWTLLSRRVGHVAIVLGPIKAPYLIGDEGTYIIQFLSDGYTELVDWEEVELVSKGCYEGI